MKNLSSVLVLLLFAAFSGDAIAQKAKSLGARRAAKLEATLEKDVAKLRETCNEKVAELEFQFAEEAGALTSKTCETLESLQKAMAADDLDLAISIRDQVTKIKERKFSTSTEGDSPGDDLLARLRGTSWKNSHDASLEWTKDDVLLVMGKPQPYFLVDDDIVAAFYSSGHVDVFQFDANLKAFKQTVLQANDRSTFTGKRMKSK